MNCRGCTQVHNSSNQQSFCPLVATTAHVPNHNFRVVLRADWLGAVHTPDTPPLKRLLRFLARVPGCSAEATGSSRCSYVTAHTHWLNQWEIKGCISALSQRRRLPRARRCLTSHTPTHCIFFCLVFLIPLLFHWWTRMHTWEMRCFIQRGRTVTVIHFVDSVQKHSCTFVWFF